MTTTFHMSREIADQPAMLEQHAEAWQARADQLRPRLAARKHVVLVGRGTSGNACTFATYLFATMHGRHPIEFRPWVAGVTTAGPSWDDAVVLAFSASGNSTDVSRAAAWLRDRGADVIGVTTAAEPGSHLGAICHELMHLEVGGERAVPATKSFCAQLFAAAALCGLPIVDAARDTAAAMRTILAAGDDDQGARLAGFLDSARQAAWIARGPALAGALDAALKLQEAAGLPALGASSAEFMHGPIGALSPADRVVIIGDNDDVGDSLVPVVASLLARGTPFVVVGPPGAIADGRIAVSLPVPMPEAEWARTAVVAMLGQRAALQLAIRRGLDPDAPPGLRKVTPTL
ncbi:MAG: SIS domain-containing protein [Kofleriaceae bacterium]|nr:SIS domain-containing protein [Myxococcales bacterium]MCB9563974.1 SIS domain-containing protein [Kofleriaceae bacterium]